MKENKKYELTDETINVGGHTLHRIKALRDFNDVKAGDLGGFIEKEDNLSHNGNCWVYDNSKVYDNTKVSGNAEVFGYATICGDARVYDNAKVYYNAKVFGEAIVNGDARIYGNVIVFGNANVYDNAEVFGGANICGYVEVFGYAEIRCNAYISNTNDYICIGPIGSRNGYTTFYLDKDKNIYVSCGCFNGTIDEFKEAVLETHKDNKFAKEYLIACDFIQSRFNIIELNVED